jgi:hypothetical protein
MLTDKLLVFLPGATLCGQWRRVSRNLEAGKSKKIITNYELRITNYEVADNLEGDNKQLTKK